VLEISAETCSDYVFGNGTIFLTPPADKCSVYPAKQRGWSIGMEVRDVGSGANVRPELHAQISRKRRRRYNGIWEHGCL